MTTQNKTRFTSAAAEKIAATHQALIKEALQAADTAEFKAEILARAKEIVSLIEAGETLEDILESYAGAWHDKSIPAADPYDPNSRHLEHKF